MKSVKESTPGKEKNKEQNEKYMTTEQLFLTTSATTENLRTARLPTEKLADAARSNAVRTTSANSRNFDTGENLKVSSAWGRNISISMKNFNFNSTTQFTFEKGTDSCSTNWSMWSDCKAFSYCGSGTQLRSRLNAECEKMNEARECESVSCMKIAHHSSPKSFCTKSCGSGKMLRSSACMQFDRRIFEKLQESDLRSSDTGLYYEVDPKVCTSTDKFANTSFEAEEVDCCTHPCTYNKNGS